MPEADPCFWPLSRLRTAFRARELSPVELTRRYLERIDAYDPALHSYITVTPELALEQARTAERRFARADGPLPLLLGVPISIKDLFDVQGVPTSLGSRVYAGSLAEQDSRPVAGLRKAGAVFLGKSNTAEFGQSATTENLLGPACVNPWAPDRTPGGSSGGAAAGVAAGLAAAALGSDGGGSIRIPAAMCGLFGLKPTLVAPREEDGFQAMTDFVCPGPIVRRVADARPLLAATHGISVPAFDPGARFRIGWCDAPDDRPVQPAVRAAIAQAAAALEDCGHTVLPVAIELGDWQEAFGPLVLADEWRFRRHLLADHRDELTDYARRSIEAAEHVSAADLEGARTRKAQIREQIASLLARYDMLLIPTAATVAFPVGERPAVIDGRAVDRLWGPFPFTAAFNVSGSPAASLPIALADGLPVGVQLVGRDHSEPGLLDACEQLEQRIAFPIDRVARSWPPPTAARPPEQSVTAAGPAGANGGDPPVAPIIVSARVGSFAVVSIARPRKRNALTLPALRELRAELERHVRDGARGVVLTGSDETFSAGMDLSEIGNGATDTAVDEEIARTARVIRELPVPVIAAIEGPCLGAAVEIALACDVRIAGAGAFFALPAARLGVLYRPDGIAAVVAELGRQTASRLLVLGERIPAADAVAAGIVAHVVEEGAAADRARALLDGIESAPREAVRATKDLIAALTSTRATFPEWEERRRALLVSPERASALAGARGASLTAGDQPEAAGAST
jgi:Asp-tRNA(Asn)/Glu-tRNA(Gln) amidotransferase A subunit family amidase/enoyl-CoA hydratase/carnithine racemase